MNLVDSCGWLEYFADSQEASFFAPAIEDTGNLIVPTVCLLEVFKRVRQQRGTSDAVEAVAAMRQGHIVDLTERIALAAAGLGVELSLPLADSVIVATAMAHQAVIWTQDAHFEGIPNVNYHART
jgi:toxin FitB